MLFRSVRFKSMVRRGQSWLTAWLNCSKVKQATVEGEVVPVKFSSWEELKIVVISRSSYQPVGQRVIMSRGSYKWD